MISTHNYSKKRYFKKKILKKIALNKLTLIKQILRRKKNRKEQIDGKEIARVEWIREGRVPLQTIREKIDYCCYTFRTIYGVLGIKVWIFSK